MSVKISDDIIKASLNYLFLARDIISVSLAALVGLILPIIEALASFGNFIKSSTAKLSRNCSTIAAALRADMS